MAERVALLVALCAVSACSEAATTSGSSVATTPSTMPTIEATTTTTLSVSVSTSTATTPAPTSTTVPPPAIDPDCPTTDHGAVVDRARQRAYLCDHGIALHEFVITTAIEQPDPGVYPVYAKTMHTSSRFGGHYSTMTHFVAFTRGKRTGARIAFHTVPVLTNGQYAQPLESVGTPERHGDSSGCIRVLPEQGPIIWDWLQTDDEVHVVS